MPWSKLAWPYARQTFFLLCCLQPLTSYFCLLSMRLHSPTLAVFIASEWSSTISSFLPLLFLSGTVSYREISLNPFFFLFNFVPYWVMLRGHIILALYSGIFLLASSGNYMAFKGAKAGWWLARQA